MTTPDQLAPAQTAGSAPLYATVSRPATTAVPGVGGDDDGLRMVHPGMNRNQAEEVRCRTACRCLFFASPLV